MAQAEPRREDLPVAESDNDFDRAMRDELDRRIAELATYTDTAFGPLRARDWAATLVLFVLLPLLLVWGLR